MYINNFTVSGFVGADSELRAAGQTDVLNFRIGNTSPFKKNGKDNETMWLRVALFGQQASQLQPRVTQGKQVVVIGELSQSKYTGNDGIEKTSLELRANSVQLVDPSVATTNANAAVDDEPTSDAELPF